MTIRSFERRGRAWMTGSTGRGKLAALVDARIATLLASRGIRPGLAASGGREQGDVWGKPNDLGQVLAEYGGQPAEQGADRLLAAFPSATDALRAAVALQRAVQRLDTDVSVGVALHSGAAGSEVASELRAVPRHLCDGASAGQILCTNVVVALLGR